ncbi:MAG: peptide ABC transporter substrate-binding protein [Anaerolineales bacterium]|nr:peptide ABC transporter substrate-binding protein [Anaerolineales bacterium]
MEKVVTQIVKETIKETVVVEGTPQVVEKEVTRIVEVEKVENETEEQSEASETGVKVARINLKREWMRSLDPQEGTQSASMGILNLIYENLMRLDNTGNLIPGAAESWEAAEDGMSMTFHLRPDLKRSDGSPLTAEHFAAVYRRAADPRLALRTMSRFLDVAGVPEVIAMDPGGNAEDIEKALDNIGVVVIDDQTLQFKFNKPAANYFGNSGYLWATYMSPTDLEVVAEKGTGWWLDAKNHISNGPWMFDRIEENQRITLVPNPYYWGEKPKLDRIEFTFIEDDGLAFEAYRNGEIDIAVVGGDYIDVIERDSTLNEELFRGSMNQIQVFGFAVQRPPFDNVLVRKAFIQAFNRDAFNSDVLKGSVRTDRSWLLPAVPGYDEAIQQPAYDPEAAVATLIKAGYGASDGTVDCDRLGEIKLSYAGSAENTLLFQFIAAQYTEVFGCPITLDPVEATALYELNNPESYPYMDYGFTSESTLFFFDYFNTWMCNGNFARSTGYCNPEMDELLNQAKMENDAEKQIEIFKSINEMFINDYSFLMVGRAEAWYLVKPYLEGFKEGFYFGDNLYPGNKAPSQDYDVDLTKVGKGYPTE